MVTILACNDSAIKVIDDAGRQLYQVALDAAPTCISLVTEGVTDGSQPTILLYGLANGNIGAVELLQDEAIVLWELNCCADEVKAPISHLKVATLKEN